jgi:hypothetical protein
MPFKDCIMRVQAWQRNLAGIGGDTEEDRNAEKIAEVRQQECSDAAAATVE